MDRRRNFCADLNAKDKAHKRFGSRLSFRLPSVVSLPRRTCLSKKCMVPSSPLVAARDSTTVFSPFRFR